MLCGVMFILPTVERMQKGKKMDKQDQMESHAFVYDSDFDKFEEEKYYGAIIDNREHSNFRAFSAEDIEDVESVQKS